MDEFVKKSVFIPYRTRVANWLFPRWWVNAVRRPQTRRRRRIYGFPVLWTVAYYFFDAQTLNDVYEPGIKELKAKYLKARKERHLRRWPRALWWAFTLHTSLLLFHCSTNMIANKALRPVLRLLPLAVGKVIEIILNEVFRLR